MILPALPDLGPLAGALDPALVGALGERGFTDLTPVQRAVLDPALEGRDLRISSQTGSGKTVAIGLALRDVVGEPGERGRRAPPRALVVTPTRELAKQVEQELSWLFSPLGATIACVTGGSSYRDEKRALTASPAVVVATPGRLLDHLERGSVDASEVRAVVLDEADRMLDMGFREDLERIFAQVPSERATHLVSATFPREVRALADRVQRDPAHVQGTPLGAANADIDHVVHLVAPRERVSAIVNLLLAQPGAQTLVFARTRADVAQLAAELDGAGFRVAPLSGDMEQRERERALSAFKRGDLDAMVATDVAARGIDVPDIARVVHAEPPTDAESYTHRSGRTGRAGKKGTSSVLTTPFDLPRTARLLERARVRYRLEPVPTAQAIRDAEAERLLVEVTRDDGPEPDAQAISLAERIRGSGEPARALARLVMRARRVGTAEPREVHPLEPPRARSKGEGAREDRPRAKKTAPGAEAREGFVPFRVSWGSAHGADARRLLAMVCRRGGIRGSDVGAIRVERSFSVVDVRSDVAPTFARATREPDPRDPRVLIREERPAQRAPRPRPDAPAPRRKKAPPPRRPR